MFPIANDEIAYKLESKLSPTGIPVETYVIRKLDMTPVAQVQIFEVRAEWIAWTGNLVRAEDQDRARGVAERRNRA